MSARFRWLTLPRLGKFWTFSCQSPPRRCVCAAPYLSGIGASGTPPGHCNLAMFRNRCVRVSSMVLLWPKPRRHQRLHVQVRVILQIRELLIGSSRTPMSRGLLWAKFLAADRCPGLAASLRTCRCSSARAPCRCRCRSAHLQRAGWPCLFDFTKVHCQLGLV